MKILLINKFHYLRGGSERVYFDTKDILEKNGHEVVCFSMQDDRNIPDRNEEFFADNVDFSSNEMWPTKILRFFYYAKAAKKLALLLEKEKPDIAHLHNISHYLTPSILKPLKDRKIPIVQTLHDYQLICPNYHLYANGTICERCKKHKYYNAVIQKCVAGSLVKSKMAATELYMQWFFRFYKEKIDLFLSPSNFLKDKIREWGVKQPVVVLNNGLNLDNFSPNYEPGNYVVCVSQLSREKGIMTLIKAMRKIPEIKLKLIGDGPQKKEIKEYIKKKQIRNVEYLGSKYDKELRDLVAGSRFSIFPSENYENYPMVVIEAMALGKPVLGSEIGGVAELISSNVTGWHFLSGNIRSLRFQIKSHFDDLEEITKIGQRAREQVEKNNCLQKYYENLLSAYDSVLGKVGMG
jgi:glycosyltransferase involved in cell wall biosynthesis